MSEELKPCPFCGGEAALKNDASVGDIFYNRWGECSACYSTSKACFDDEEAIKAWNTRAEPDYKAIAVKTAEKQIALCSQIGLYLSMCEEMAKQLKDLELEIVQGDSLHRLTPSSYVNLHIDSWLVSRSFRQGIKSKEKLSEINETLTKWEKMKGERDD